MHAMKVYTDYEAEKFLSKYLPVARNQLVQRVEEIKIKLPFVLKIISKDALHKSEIRGVRIIHHPEEVESNFSALLSIAKEKKLQLDGILVQEYSKGMETIIGIKRDEVFGHVLMFGLGGIFTEVLEDIAIRKCPITYQDAGEMIDELKARKIFYGFRGQRVHLGFLKRMLVRASLIPLKLKELQELDINPFILGEHGGKVVDARMVVS